MLHSDLQIAHCTKMIIMILSHYKKICDKIRSNLTESQHVFIALNAWFSSQRVAYLRVLIYWVDVKFQFREHFIEFTSLNIEHIDCQLMMKLMKILKNYVIKNKLFKIVINNASNNNILKEKLEKIMSCRKFQWNRTQNFINCLTHIINLMIQDFIQALESKTIVDNVIAQLKNDQVQDIETSKELSVVIKKILLQMIMQLITRFICMWCWLWIFWFYSVLNRSQKSQEISIQRSSNDVRTLRDQKSHHAEFSFMQQHSLLTITIDLWRELMTCWCQ